MEARLPLYLVAALGGLLVLSVAVLLFIRMPAHATLAGLPAPVTVQVGALPDEYASAVSTRLLDLLLTWTQENRIPRFKEAVPLMSGEALKRYKKWALSSLSILDTLQVEQRARLTPVSVKRISQDLFETETRVELRRYTGGLGGSTEHSTYRLLLRRLTDEENRTAVLCVVGLRQSLDASTTEPTAQPTASLETTSHE